MHIFGGPDNVSVSLSLFFEVMWVVHTPITHRRVCVVLPPPPMAEMSGFSLLYNCTVRSALLSLLQLKRGNKPKLQTLQTPASLCPSSVLRKGKFDGQFVNSSFAAD